MSSHRQPRPPRPLLPVPLVALVPLGHKGLARLLLLAGLGSQGVASAQDLEPRRWTHLPVGMNVASLTYGYTDGDLKFDPVLVIEDARVETHSLVAAFVRAFDCFDKTGRVDLIAPYQTTRWDGLLEGTPASAEREGFADPWLRLSVDLVGAPPLKGKEYMQYRAARPVHTVVGAALGVLLPLGEYKEDKVLNLGQNRFTIRPQVGALHIRGPWSYELTSSVSFFTDNDEFFGSNERTQDVVYTLQGHVIRTFQNDWWASVSSGYSWGGESEINGLSQDDARGDVLTAFSMGLPIGKTQGLKLVYFRSDTLEEVGGHTGSVFVSWSTRF